MIRILVVDDDAGILGLVSALLRTENYDITALDDGTVARDRIQSGAPFDLLITDLRMEPLNGCDLLRFVRRVRPEMAVIVVTGFGTIESAIEAMRLGAFDYLTKPFQGPELLMTVRRALEYRALQAENAHLRMQLHNRGGSTSLIAESPSMRRVCQIISAVAPTDSTVLIYGESGTGKEVVAKAIHAASLRQGAPLLAVNCAALPEALLESEMFGHVKGAFTGASAGRKGLFEAANGGSLFLDEIGSMPLSIQGKLLRALQEKEIRRVGDTETTIKPRP